VSSKAVEPYIPVALQTSTATAIDYQPTPPAELRRVASSTAPESQSTDPEPDLVIDANPEEIDASVDDFQTEPMALPPKKTQQTSTSVASTIVKPNTSSSTREKKIIGLNQYRKRHSEERPRTYHPRSRTPPRQRFNEPRWAPRGSSSRSPRTDRRDESPPRRLVLTGGDLEEYLKYKDKARQE